MIVAFNLNITRRMELQTPTFNEKQWKLYVTAILITTNDYKCTTYKLRYMYRILATMNKGQTSPWNIM